MDTEVRSEEFFYRIYDHVKGDMSGWIRDVSSVARDWGLMKVKFAVLLVTVKGKGLSKQNMPLMEK
jgi:hypothetical protein